MFDSLTPTAVLLDGRSGDHSGFLTVLDDAERSRYERMSAPGRRRDFVLGRALAKVTAARLDAGDRQPPSIAVDGHGNPSFEGSELKLSISHSHGWVAVAVGPDAIGIDIQTLVDELPARIVGPNETAWVEGLTEPERRAALTWLWTIKEARGKLAGTGLRFPLAEVPVPLQEQDVDDSVRWRLFDHDEVRGAIATESTAELPTTIETIDLQKLAQRTGELVP